MASDELKEELERPGTTGRSHAADDQRLESSAADYKNSLLAAVGYLDLTNALDFPANVWNQSPLPLYVKCLMGLGGSIAILATTIAVWDMWRSWKNIEILREERAYLVQRRRDAARLHRLEEAWLKVNFRELGWEIIDRFAMDAFMTASGILVGTGTLLAIRGDVPTVFQASNILSGYLGNSFIAAYALFNVVWSTFMWKRARLVDLAAARAKNEVDAMTSMLMQRHAGRHKLYSFTNGLSFLIAGVGSEVSATLWQGYVVLIPCIAASIFCNCFWRFCLGYDRCTFTNRAITSKFNLVDHVRMTNQTVSALADDALISTKLSDLVQQGSATSLLEFMQQCGLRANNHYDSQEMHCAEDATDMDQTFNTTVRVRHKSNSFSLIPALKIRFRDEQRFLLELLGCWLGESNNSQI